MLFNPTLNLLNAAFVFKYSQLGQYSYATGEAVYLTDSEAG